MTSQLFHTTSLFYTITLAALLSIVALPSYAESNLKISTGYDYTVGKYGQNVDTEIETIPVTMNYLDGAWSYKLTIPYIRITGNGTVVPGTGTFGNFNSGLFGGGMGGNASATQTVTNSGLGDITASMGYGFFPDNAFYEISARVKFGTADADKGLGTGENDYYLQFDGVLGMNNTLSPFFTLGYVFTGDSASYTYEDVPYGAIGLMFKTSASSSLGISYDYRQSLIAGSDDFKQASAFVNWKVANNWAATVSILNGFTNSSPDSGYSLMFTRSY